MGRPKRTEDQETGIGFLKSHPRAMLADEQGKGKTRMLLEAAEGSTLVVCPAYTLTVWEEEHAKWAPSLDISMVSYGTVCKRSEDARGNRTISEPVPRAELNRDWDTLILDESHYIKGYTGSRSANWTRAIVKKLHKRADRVWLASGTPIPNWAHELWSAVRLLDPDNEFTRSYWRWVDYWFDVWKPRWGGTKVKDLKDDWTWDQFTAENLGDNYLRREWSDDEFPFSEQVISCPMVPEQRRVYQELKRNYRASVSSGDIVAWSDGDLAPKLHKVSTGLEVELGTELNSTKYFQSGKLNVLADLFEDRPEPLVVFCWYRPTARAITQLANRCGRRVATRSGDYSRKDQDDAYRRFQSGDVDVLVGTLATTSESITLTRASTCVFVERSWRPSTNKQAIGRLRRMGQQNPIRVLHLVTDKTVDQSMLKVLAAKTDQQSRAIPAREFADML